MFLFRHIFLTILVFALAEAVLLAKVGTAIGWPITILMIVTTAMIGSAMFRHQGLATWLRVNERMAQGEMPGQELIEGVLLLLGGALLITPGFITDAIGFACLIPATRKPMAKWMLSKGVMQAMSQQAGSVHGSTWVYRETHTTYGSAGQPQSPFEQMAKQQRDAAERNSTASNNLIEGEFIAKDDSRSD